MTGINWRALIVEDESHSAIYAETFAIRLADALADGTNPAGAIDALDTTAALEVLATFAGAWGSLHRDAQGHRWQYRSVVTAGGDVSVLAFRAVTLDPDERRIASTTSNGPSRPPALPIPDEGKGNRPSRAFPPRSGQAKSLL